MTESALYPTPAEAAPVYGLLGWRVAPVTPGSKIPSVKAWQVAASADEKVIRAWWERWPDHGVCIVTGRATGLWVLDVDVADGKPGLESLKALVAEHNAGHLPETLVARTPSGGYHYYFSYPVDAEIRNNASSKLGPGLDVRGEGGQVNAAPTMRGDACYRWVDGRAPWDAEVQPAPQWLVDLVAERAQTPDVPQVVAPPQDAVSAFLAGRNSDATWVEEYNRHTAWAELLAGWTEAFTDRDGVTHWVRPGKERRDGTSATTNFAGLDCLYVYTTSIPWLPCERMYDKYGFMVHRDYGGDFTAAGRDLGTKAKPSLSAQTADLLRDVPPATPIAESANPPVEETPPLSRLHSLEIDFSPDGPFWNDDESADEWLIRDFVGRGRGHALYAGAKTGKSFVALDAIAASCIPGHTAWTMADERITVIYLDYEMTEADVRERLVGFGYGPEDDYSQFHYVRAMAFGSDLDTHEGGAELLAYAQAREADLVVVDTMSRAVRGDENDADTVRHFYQATGGLLKGHGIALLRLDHAGKSSDKGQRGSSGKNDDVDVVWRLERKDEGGSEMTCTHKRMHWVPDKVNIVSSETDGIVSLRRAAGDSGWPAGTKEKVALMDAAGLALDASRQEIRDAGVKGRSDVLAAAVRWRKQRSMGGIA